MNYYEILKISKNATESEIKSSYKSLVKKYHPDLYAGDKDFAEHKIKEINEAYNVLSDPEKKAEYDEYLNPKPQNQDSINSQTYSYTSSTTYDNIENNYDTQNESESWSLTQFISNKLNKLDSKQQLKIFIFVLVFVLALFLINLVKMKEYLETNIYYYDEYDDYEDFDNKEYEYDDEEDYYDEDDYLEEDFDIDEYLYNFFKEYEDEIRDQYNSISENDISI